jgi:hypothetical protein
MCGTQIPLLALPANTNIQQLESSHPVLKNKAFEAGVAQLNGKSVRVDFSDEFKNQQKLVLPKSLLTGLRFLLTKILAVRRIYLNKITKSLLEICYIMTRENVL